MMKFCLPLILAVAASPAFAQQKLPFEFFLECDGSEKGELLVLVKGNMFFFKKPILKFDTFENNSDALTTGGFYPSLFNKWNSTFVHDEIRYDNCVILDPDSRQPLFK